MYMHISVHAHTYYTPTCKQHTCTCVSLVIQNIVKIHCPWVVSFYVMTGGAHKFYISYKLTINIICKQLLSPEVEAT